jgi:D-alanyl-D-alanine dipeptidase
MLGDPADFVDTSEPLGPDIAGSAVDANHRALPDRLVIVRSYDRKQPLASGGQMPFAALTPEAAAAWYRMVAYARKDGIELKLNSTFRDDQAQERVFKNSPKGGAARPGYSNHRTATAIDIDLGVPIRDMTTAKIYDNNFSYVGFDKNHKPLGTHSGSDKTRHDSGPIYRWLAQHAGQFGFRNLDSAAAGAHNEAWHYDYAPRTK